MTEPTREQELERYADRLERQNKRLVAQVAKLQAACKLKDRGLFDDFLCAALAKASGPTAKDIAEDAERIAVWMMRCRARWEAGQSVNQTQPPPTNGTAAQPKVNNERHASTESGRGGGKPGQPTNGSRGSVPQPDRPATGHPG